jgi:hypothetical protein
MKTGSSVYRFFVVVAVLFFFPNKRNVGKKKVRSEHVRSDQSKKALPTGSTVVTPPVDGLGIPTGTTVEPPPVEGPPLPTGTKVVNAN